MLLSWCACQLNVSLKNDFLVMAYSTKTRLCCCVFKYKWSNRTLQNWWFTFYKKKTSIKSL